MAKVVFRHAQLNQTRSNAISNLRVSVRRPFRHTSSNPVSDRSLIAKGWL